MRYVYSFSVWPSETWGFPAALFQLFRLLNGRVEMVFSREEFEAFRSSVGHTGFTLREIERVTHAEPEPVS